MKASSLYESPYLSAGDIGPKLVTLAIAGVSEGVFKNGNNDDNSKLVVHFADSAKALVLSRQNAKRLIEALGDETDDWIGAKVTLTIGRVNFSGKAVASIQIAAIANPKKAK